MPAAYGTFHGEQTPRPSTPINVRATRLSRPLLGASLAAVFGIFLCGFLHSLSNTHSLIALSSGSRLDIKVQQLEGGMSSTEWGSYDPVTGVPRLLCSDTVANAFNTRLTIVEKGGRKEYVSPRNRFYGSTIFAPQGIGLSRMGYTADQEADAFCTDGSGASGANKNHGCPDPCAYSLCNEGESFIVQCPKACYGTSDSKPVYGQYDKQKKTVVAPYEDQSSICRAAILAGVDPSYGKENFYATITIQRPVRSYQDELGAW
jgi:hypothetical protein